MWERYGWEVVVWGVGDKYFLVIRKSLVTFAV